MTADMKLTSLRGITITVNVVVTKRLKFRLWAMRCLLAMAAKVAGAEFACEVELKP